MNSLQLFKRDWHQQGIFRQFTLGEIVDMISKESSLKVKPLKKRDN